MPICQASDLSYQLANGEIVLENISFSLQSPLTGLVGRNGTGKSLLASLITGDRMPARGHLQVTCPVAVYKQEPVEMLQHETSIVQLLGLAPIVDAIQRIADGECSELLFDRVGDNWRVEERLRAQLAELALPGDIHLACRKLSGGQLARLRLWHLFSHHQGLLVLDEPSNHLDTDGKRWLINEMHKFRGHILLISHDRMMLREVNEIWELSQSGITRYGGNYDLYHHEKTLSIEAIDAEIAQLRRQEKRVKHQWQSQQEKADQRAAQGNRIRKTGSQPKVLLDYKKNSAGSAASSRKKQNDAQGEHLVKKLQALRNKKEDWQVQRLTIPEQDLVKGQVLTLRKLKLPFVSLESIDMQLGGIEKIRILGSNGCGKSTLLKVVSGEAKPVSGEVHLRSETSYLDQRFSCINNDMSVLDNFLLAAGNLDNTTARTYLAAGGLAAGKVDRPAISLSGGERMKLAILMITHQPGPTLLLLDEPDNHLDLDTKQVLASALKAYQGPIMIVSHDDDFISACGVTRHYAMSLNQSS
jgi:ATPase subunit of ABC transporter with duplicated ATPase domains